ncbi:MAG: replication factor C large subunit [Nanoarchaeota archaeon]
MQPWVRQYAPQTTKDVVGQEDAVKQLMALVKGYSPGKKAAFLHGPSGTGKTSSVMALAHDLHLEIVEINASDVRNKDALNSLVGSASKQRSLFSTGKIILVDEVDGLAGNQDRGGIGAMSLLQATSAFPFVYTAADPYTKKLAPLRKKAQLIAFLPLPYLEVYQQLVHVAKKEGLEYDEHALKSLARRAGGDLRAAINDLQSFSGGKRLTNKDLAHLSDRAFKEKIQDALARLFKTTDAEIARHTLDNLDEDLDEVMHWLDENLPQAYTEPSDLARAYEALAKADVYRGRIRRWQHWRFLVYISGLISVGVASAKEKKYTHAVSLQRTRRLLKVWMAAQKNLKRKAIAEKIAAKTHSSSRRALQDTLPYVKSMFRKQKGAFTEYFDLDPEEAAWMGR